MVNKQNITEGIRLFASRQLESVASNNSLLNFAKPLVSRFIDNNMYKLDKYLDFFANKDGLIDSDGIFSEMISNIINSKPFTVDTKIMGDAIIGDGQIKLTIPYINQRLVLSHEDLVELKNLINKNNIL